MVPETLLRRSPQLAVKIDKVISALSRKYLSIFVSTLESDAMKVDFGMLRKRTLWVSWAKKSSGVASDVTEDVIREVALPLGFVDIKVCAVDETWSGLKLMIRCQNRKS